MWLPAHRAADKTNGPYVMGYYTRDDIRSSTRWPTPSPSATTTIAAVQGPTWPNRLFWQTGNNDPDGGHGGPITSNSHPDGRTGGRRTPSGSRRPGELEGLQRPERLNNYSMLGQFQQFQQRRPRKSVVDKGMKASSTGQFEYDALHDTLPTVSWLMPPNGQSEHPRAGRRPAQGAAYVASKIAAIAANPDVWKKTVFILDYDENDGLFDHVVPPTPPPGTAHEYVDGLPVGGGFGCRAS